MVIFDTSVIIDHLRQNQATPSPIEHIIVSTSHTPAISLITVQELYQGKSTIDPEKEAKLLQTISLCQILDYTYQIAVLAGNINRDLDQPIEFADATIAATTITHNASLLTLNKKHFNSIPDLKLL